MFTIKNEPLFFLILVIVALLHILFSQIANTYDRKIYATNIQDDEQWFKTVEPYMSMSASLVLASILLFIVYVGALILVYGFSGKIILPTLGLIISTVIFAFIESKKTIDMFGEEHLMDTDERAMKLLNIRKNKKK